jgi:hypothetical protein
MDPSSASHFLQKLQGNNNSPSTKTYPTHLENISDRHKVAILTLTFPGIRPDGIKRTLKKCRGLVVHAIDVLLDQVFLKGSGHTIKRVRFSTESKPDSCPRVTIMRKVPEIVSSRPRRLPNTDGRSEVNGRLKNGTERHCSTSSTQSKPPPKSSLENHSIKTSNNKGNANVLDFAKVPHVPKVGKRKDDGRGDGKAKSMRRRTGKKTDGGQCKGITKAPER